LPFFCRELKNVKSQFLQTKQTAKRLWYLLNCYKKGGGGLKPTSF
jgi:hypothetical protein